MWLGHEKKIEQKAQGTLCSIGVSPGALAKGYKLETGGYVYDTRAGRDCAAQACGAPPGGHCYLSVLFSNFSLQSFFPTRAHPLPRLRNETSGQLNNFFAPGPRLHPESTLVPQSLFCLSAISHPSGLTFNPLQRSYTDSEQTKPLGRIVITIRRPKKAPRNE